MHIQHTHILFLCSCNKGCPSFFWPLRLRLIITLSVLLLFGVVDGPAGCTALFLVKVRLGFFTTGPLLDSSRVRFKDSFSSSVEDLMPFVATAEEVPGKWYTEGERFGDPLAHWLLFSSDVPESPKDREEVASAFDLPDSWPHLLPPSAKAFRRMREGRGSDRDSLHQGSSSNI